jgi:hypothetical protein
MVQVMADFKVELHGDDALMRRLVVGNDRAKSAVAELVDDLATRGEHYIRLYAPSYSGELMRRIGRTPVRGHGPAGMEAVVGVHRGMSNYPLFVHRGTGIYGRTGQFIQPSKPGGVLTFQKRGEPRRFKKWVRGQEEQPFVRRAYELMIPYARLRMAHVVDRLDTRSTRI